MIAASRQELLDIEALLQTMPELASIYVNSIFRGVTEGEVDMHLQGVMVPSGKLSGAIILVMQPAEKPTDKGGSTLVVNRIHTIRIIEAVTVNRKPGWESNTAKLACGYTCDELKDLVKQRLHIRHLGSASLMQGDCKDFSDPKGGIGYDVEFSIVGQLGTEVRDGIQKPTLSGGFVTLTGTGAAGEVIRYTTDGTTPLPGGATVQTYTVPFAAVSGQLVRCSARATGKNDSSFQQLLIP